MGFTQQTQVSGMPRKQEEKFDYNSQFINYVNPMKMLIALEYC